ncbi:MAG: hypothetical protein RBS40_13250 [Rhodocyclaceae bacterium]|jgi:hypothetical protein|nr:hypothetical protein [Rhodocyclaceae bacterium]
MKSALMVAGVVLAVGGMGEAFALCGSVQSDNRLNQTQIGTALSGKRINAVAPGGEDWKEDHCAGGDLYKVGGGTAVDPRVKRGTWSIVGTGVNATVRYAYTDGSTYTWSMYQTSGTTYFCNGSAEVAHIVTTGTAGTPCN